jgi:hypothetical protein
MPPLSLKAMYWPHREHLEHEWDSPEGNEWYLLTHKRVVGPFLFDEGIITMRSHLYTLENHVLPQPSSSSNNNNNNINNLIFQLNSVPVHLGHSLHVRLNVNFPGWWIRRVGPILLPPCSPHLLPLDLFLGAAWKVNCTAKEWMHWMNSKLRSLEQFQMLH